MGIPHVNIPKVSGPGAGHPGWWTMTEGDKVRVMVNCGECGRHAGELLDHSIQTDGTVHASIGCPRDGCSWHVWGKLLDWAHGFKPAGQSLALPT